MPVIVLAVLVIAAVSITGRVVYLLVIKPVSQDEPKDDVLSSLVKSCWEGPEGLPKLISFLEKEHGIRIMLEYGILIIPPKFYSQCSPDLCAGILALLVPKFSSGDDCKQARGMSVQEIGCDIADMSAEYRESFLAAIDRPAEGCVWLSMIRRRINVQTSAR